MIRIRILSLLVLSLALGGCAASAALQIASLGMSSLSYAVSGKSLSDHALSIALQRDCTLLRVVQGRLPCRRAEPAEPGAGPLLAETSPSTFDEWAIELPSPDVLAPDVQPVESSPPTGSPRTVESSRAVAASNPIPVSLSVKLIAPAKPRLFAVIASFANRPNARELQTRHDRLSTTIVPFRTKGRTLYRVMLGPFEERRFEPVRSRLLAAGFDDAWPLRLCPDSMAPPPCGTLVAQVD